MIHVCFNLDKNYVEPCKVCMNSILSNTKEEITFHLLGIDVSDFGDTDVENLIFYPDIDVSCFSKENLEDYYYFSKAAMYRLLIPYIVETDRAIYIDIDTLILDDIKNLWDMEVDYVGAIIDPCNLQHLKRLKLKTDAYVNSGVILFNSKKIRKEFKDYKKAIIKAQKDFVLELKDQDIFNIIFNKHISIIDYKWNIDVYNLKEKGESKTTSKAKDKAYENPSLVHCMGSRKWWAWEGLPFGEEWDSYNKTMRINGRNTFKVLSNGIVVVTRR